MLSDDYANGLLDYTFGGPGGGEFTFPTGAYLALLNEMPACDEQPLSGEVSTGQGGSDPENPFQLPTGYERLQLEFDSASNQQSVNSERARFSRVERSWGSVRGLAITTQQSSQYGNSEDKWVFAVERCSKEIIPGRMAPSIAAGDLKVRLKLCECTVGSDYLVNGWLDALLTGAEFQRPSEGVFLAYLKRMPMSSDENVEEVEAGESGYQRAKVQFAKAEGQAIHNDKAVEFPDPEKDWSTPDAPIVAAALFDQGGSSGGQWLLAWPICPLVISEGDAGQVLAPHSVRVGFACCDQGGGGGSSGSNQSQNQNSSEPSNPGQSGQFPATPFV